MLWIKQWCRSLCFAGCGTELCMSTFLLGYFSSAFIQCCGLMIGMGNLCVELSVWDSDIRSIEWLDWTPIDIYAGKYATRSIVLNRRLVRFSHIYLIPVKAHLNCSLVHLQWFAQALRLIKFAAGKAGSEFRREIQRQAPVIRNLLHHRLDIVLCFAGLKEMHASAIDLAV